MNSPSPWSFGQDPLRDAVLAGLLRQADVPPPGADVDWERLHSAVMRSASGLPAAGLRAAPGASPREWWGVLAQWRRAAAAASVAAMLGAGALLWNSGADSPELAVEGTPPESVALARVVASYPDDAVFRSLIQAARTDELLTWGDQ